MEFGKDERRWEMIPAGANVSKRPMERHPQIFLVNQELLR